MPSENVSGQTVFDAVGGQQFFDELIGRFYRRVQSDRVLRPLYPDDLTASRDALALFLGQYWGGPATYSESRGHPRLRMRHAPFVIAQRERDAWLAAMLAALDEMAPAPPIATAMREYFEMAATAMINSD